MLPQDFKVDNNAFYQYNSLVKGAHWFTRNNTIVLFNLVSACMLLFCVFFFFFSNMQVFLDDITGYMFFSPLLLLLGALFVCFYITMLIFYLFESKTVWLADRFDLPYKIICSVILLLLIIRAFLLGYFTESALLFLPPFVIIAILSGIITWVLPKIKDNDNTDF